ncbi:RNA polymerase sigma factor [Agromyces sp. NPDC056965]|uniref:RNA polymerase sigma factor n=1 Tax=Agromyces sp. NPDC056965 TaxID=3345983 RepID=UPI00363AE694
MTSDARQVAAHAARASFGRLVALLVSANANIAEAEDAVAAALEQALRSWPATGIPANPEGWLLTVARNRQRDAWRSAAHRTGAELDADDPRMPYALDEVDPGAIGDRRLELMFACADPAVDAGVRTPLMLQLVLGFTAAQIAAAYGVAPAGLTKRLVRAKRRIRDAGIPFAIPDRASMPHRLSAVLEAVYGCYAIAWRDADGRSHREPDSMAGEALHLATTLAVLLDAEAEAWSLAALIALSLSRAEARSGVFVPLDEQDPATWDAALIVEGEGYLRRAGELGGTPGRFQLEAAMQAVHAARVRGAAVDWAALTKLSRVLVAVAPTAGARIASAAVVGRTDGPEIGLALLDELPPGSERLSAFHATRGDLLTRAGRRVEASAAFARAAELETDAAAAAYLRSRAQ